MAEQTTAVQATATSPALHARRPGSDRLVTILVLIVALAAPFIVKGFVTFQFTLVLIYAIAIVGLNILTGFNGQFSLGHSAFLAVGAYVSGILISIFGVPYFWTVPIAALVGFVVGFLFGFPARRLEGMHLALATFALAVATPQLLKLSVFQQWTRGVQGIVLTRPDPPFELPLTQDQWYYYLVLACAVVVYLLTTNLAHSRSGRALMAIRDNPIAASTMGINVALYKPLAFGLSALYTSVAGALGAIVAQFIAPDSYSFFLSITILVGLVIGGIGWIPGAILGGAFVLFVPNIAEYFSQGLAGAVYGVFLVILVYFAPGGAKGVGDFVKRQFRRKSQPSKI